MSNEAEGRTPSEVECSHMAPCTPDYRCSMHRKSGRVRSPLLCRWDLHIWTRWKRLPEPVADREMRKCRRCPEAEDRAVNA